MSRGYAIPSYLSEREDRAKVKSAFDPDMPTYGEPVHADRQNIDGLSFADLRDQMDTRRRRTLRRMDDCDY